MTSNDIEGWLHLGPYLVLMTAKILNLIQIWPHLATKFIISKIHRIQCTLLHHSIPRSFSFYSSLVTWRIAPHNFSSFFRAGAKIIRIQNPVGFSFNNWTMNLPLHTKDSRPAAAGSVRWNLSDWSPWLLLLWHDYQRLASSYQRRANPLDATSCQVFYHFFGHRASFSYCSAFGMRKIKSIWCYEDRYQEPELAFQPRVYRKWRQEIWHPGVAQAFVLLLSSFPFSSVRLSVHLGWPKQWRKLMVFLTQSSSTAVSSSFRRQINFSNFTPPASNCFLDAKDNALVGTFF